MIPAKNGERKRSASTRLEHKSSHMHFFVGRRAMFGAFDRCASITRWKQAWKRLSSASALRVMLALAVAIQGVMNGLMVLLPRRPGPLTLLRQVLGPLAPFSPMHWVWPLFVISQKMAIVLGFFLLIIAFGLARGKQQAWSLACILFPLACLSQLARGVGLLSTLPTLLVFAFLLASKPLFPVKSDPWRSRQGLLLLGSGALLFLGYTLGGFYLLQDQFAFSEHIEDLLTGWFLQSLHLPSSAIVPLTRHARWFLQSLSSLSAVILMTGLFFLLRPISRRWWTTCHKERLDALRLKAVEMVSQYGGQTLSFFALAPENLPYVAPHGDGLLHYRLSGKVATVLGDPVCPPEQGERVTRAFLSLCRANDWQVSFY